MKPLTGIQIKLLPVQKSGQPVMGRTVFFMLEWLDLFRPVIENEIITHKVVFIVVNTLVNNFVILFFAVFLNRHLKLHGIGSFFAGIRKPVPIHFLQHIRSAAHLIKLPHQIVAVYAGSPVVKADDAAVHVTDDQRKCTLNQLIRHIAERKVIDEHGHDSKHDHRHIIDRLGMDREQIQYKSNHKRGQNDFIPEAVKFGCSRNHKQIRQDQDRDQHITVYKMHLIKEAAFHKLDRDHIPGHLTHRKHMMRPRVCDQHDRLNRRVSLH